MQQRNESSDINGRIPYQETKNKGKRTKGTEKGRRKRTLCVDAGTALCVILRRPVFTAAVTFRDLVYEGIGVQKNWQQDRAHNRCL